MNNPIDTLLVGCGYWGKNLLRNVQANPNFLLAGIVDSDETLLRDSLKDYSVPKFKSIQEFLDSGLKADFATVATRPKSHETIVKELLEAGMNVLLTKPFGDSLESAQNIIAKARETNKKVFVDFTYLYASFIRALYKNLDRVGKPLSYTSYRTALGIIQSDTDVIADLLCHDLSILFGFVENLPSSVQCVPIEDLDGKLTNVFVKLKWNSGFVANIHCSWNSARKIRHIALMGTNGSLLIDELNSNAPVSYVFHSTNAPSEKEIIARNISYTLGSLEVVSFVSEEPLKTEFVEIAEILKGEMLEEYNKQINMVTKTWTVMEAARKSAANCGAIIEIKNPLQP